MDGLQSFARAAISECRDNFDASIAEFASASSAGEQVQAELAALEESMRAETLGGLGLLYYAEKDSSSRLFDIVRCKACDLTMHSWRFMEHLGDCSGAAKVSPPLRARTASARAASAGDVEVFSPAEPREAKPAAGRGSAGVAKPARGKGRLAAPARARLGVVPAAAAQPKPDRSPRAPPVWTVPVPRRPRSRLLRVPRTSAPRFLADLEGRADPAPADYAPPAPAARSRAQAGPPSAQARPVASKGKRGRLPGQRQATSPAAPPASRPRGPAPLPAGPVASLPDVASLPGTLSVPAAHAPRPTAFPAVDLPAPGPSDPAAWAPFAPFPQGAFPAPGAHPMFGDVGDHLETDSGALLAAPVDVMDDLGPPPLGNMGRDDDTLLPMWEPLGAPGTLDEFMPRTELKGWVH